MFEIKLSLLVLLQTYTDHHLTYTCRGHAKKLDGRKRRRNIRLPKVSGLSSRGNAFCVIFAEQASKSVLGKTPITEIPLV